MSYAASIVPALQALQEVLATAGVPSSLDRAKLPVPGAWITPATVSQVNLAGDGLLVAHVLLVAQESGEAEALGTLTGLLGRLLEVIDPDGDVDTSVVLTRPNASPLPAFRVPVSLECKES